MIDHLLASPKGPPVSEHLEASRLELWLAGGVLAIATALCLPAAATLSFIWERSEFYGHAYAIPVVAGYFVYARRRALAAALRSFEPPAFGAPVAFAAGAFEVLALMGDVRFGAELGIPLVLGAGAYAIGGRPLLKPLLLPLFFLALMVPPPRYLTDEILLRLKMVVTHSAVSLLQATGQTVVADGNQIVLPRHTLFVADACSGLTSIVTLLPLACIVAYFLCPGVWRRGLVIASVVPMAMAANILRVVGTVLLVSSHGVAFAQGLLHESFGLATSVLGTLAVVGVARVVR